MPDLVINLFFPIIVSILGGVVVSLIEYKFIPAKEKTNIQREVYSRKKQFKLISWGTTIGGLVGAIILPIIVAVFPDLKRIILDAFSFITSDPIKGSALIATIGGILGCLLGTIYKNIAGAIVYAPIMGAGVVVIVWFYGGIALLIFKFGQWDYIGALLSEWSKWAFWGGAVLGAVVGSSVGNPLLDYSENSQALVINQESQQALSVPSDNLCSNCGRQMRVQKAIKGEYAGEFFYVCSSCGQIEEIVSLK